MKIPDFRCVLVAALALASVVLMAAQAPPQSMKPDSTDEGFVMERITFDITFAEDGTARQEQSARIRIQSDGGVKQFGVLSFPYSGDIERIDSIQIQVTKPDGRVIATPESNVQDLAAQATREAPMYSDLREKQAPVKSLGVGDVLEWRTRTVRSKPDVPGQFWFGFYFNRRNTVLEESLRIAAPAAKYVKVSCPSLKAEIHEDSGNKVYLWKTSHSLAGKVEEVAKKRQLRPPPDVQLTTFKSWQELGEWYGGLQKSRVEVTPAVQAKATELIGGLTTNLEKQRAIYRFVATEFRYVSVSFGIGRYQPHAAEEILANQYGDCKDKHTLFAALLKAAGIEAWPALISTETELDPDMPSPAQFNHVITYIPQGEVWLDTTPEVARYGWLLGTLRDRQALVIPVSGAARLATTAKSPPDADDSGLDVEPKLSAEGTLTGHFKILARGDTEFVLRSAFHQTAPNRWTELAQGIAAGMGYGGKVSELDVDNPSKIDAPFHYSYHYERENYSDWANRRITPPLPPIGLIPFEDADKPVEPMPIGGPGSSANHATVQLPDGYSAELPRDVKLQTEFADYSATYSLEKGTVTAERVFTVKAPELAVDQWEKYQAFAKAVYANENQYIHLVRASALPAAAARDMPEAGELVQRAWQAIQSRDLNAASDALDQAERLNHQQSNLWWGYAAVAELQGQNEKTINGLTKEIEYHPGNEQVYRMLAATQRRLGHKADAIETLWKLVRVAPGNADGTLDLSTALFENKDYAKAVAPLQAALKVEPENPKLGVSLVEARLRGGEKAAGLAALDTMRQRKLDAATLNSAAWVLADLNIEPALAKEMATRAGTEYEGRLKDVTLATLTDDQLKVVNSIGATWDTAGWAAFRLGDLKTAERYVHAAWVLVQHAAAADHLGQIYERQGKRADAIHAYQLALAANRNLEETRERLKKLGGPAPETQAYKKGTATSPAQVPTMEELSELRTWRVAELSYQHGTADFFLLFSKDGIVDVQFVRGDESLKPAAAGLGKLQYKMAFPDDGPEMIARRGILSCSQITTPSCTFVLLLPANTTK